MKQGDLVVRKSYGGDVLFRIAAFVGRQAVLRGMDYRLLADSPYEDLQTVRNPDELTVTKQARFHANESLRRMSEERARQTERGGYISAIDDRDRKSVV